MSDEITLSVAIAVLKASGVELPNWALDFTADMAGDDVDAGTQLIGTTKEDLVIKSDLVNPHWMLLYNQGPTNYVEYGLDADTPLGKILVGKANLISLAPGVTLSLKANTAACRVFFIAVEV